MNDQPNKTESDSNLNLLGFALADCVVEIDRESAKYLRAVHRTALELATPNCFGAEIGGFWLMQAQLTQLRRLPDFYPAQESASVARAVEAYIHAQAPVRAGWLEQCASL
ncbi:MAG TPA: hypothetical protein VJU86_02380 [Pyrinomonadaceae bacterium]|nr:hypothetical protein [Pyrinomonadaceae bacterium]